MSCIKWSNIKHKLLLETKPLSLFLLSLWFPFPISKEALKSMEGRFCFPLQGKKRAPHKYTQKDLCLTPRGKNDLFPPFSLVLDSYWKVSPVSVCLMLEGQDPLLKVSLLASGQFFICYSPLVCSDSSEAPGGKTKPISKNI